MKPTKPQSIITKIYIYLSHEEWDIPYIAILLIFEAILCTAIIHFIPYTEIDWEAYMQEVTCWQNGERDYMNIRGGTGPLVYPAGFLYLYGFFKWLTDSSNGNIDNDIEGYGNGGGDAIETDILMAQKLFCVVYIIHATIVFFIYNTVMRNQCNQFLKIDNVSSQASSADDEKTLSDSSSLKIAHKIWSWRIGMGLMCFSKRIHSIFVLRLFNDAPCMLLCYLSVLLFLKNKFYIGCFFFSLAVSIKMNVLLFAPGLLLLLLQHNRNFIGTIKCLSICAVLQLILGAPFLLSYPISYIKKAFEFDRVFFFKWTVNWKFLPEDIFVSKGLSILLLTSHIVTLILLSKKWIQSVKKQTKTGTALFIGKTMSPTYIVYTIFVSNFVGIVFARTLHYQFYEWYFHSLVLMLWLTDIPIMVRILLIGMVELSFNVFPATPISSLCLQISHGVTLIGIWKAKVPLILEVSDKHYKQE